MFPSGNRFVPSVETLELRETPSAVSGRITGIAVDPEPAAVVPTGSVRFIVDGVQVNAAARHFNGFVSRFPAGGSNETITIGGPRTDTDARPTVLLHRLANPSLPGAPDNANAIGLGAA